MTAVITTRPEPARQSCEVCGTESAVLTHQREQFLYGADIDGVTLEAFIPVWACSACGSQYAAEGAEEARHAAVCAHLGRLSPQELRELRQANGLSQEAWADLTGVGIASVKRWETGNKIQNESIDLFFRLLQSPVAFERLKGVKAFGASVVRPVFRTALQDAALEDAKLFRLRPDRSETDRTLAA